MSDDVRVQRSALEPLYEPWEEPTAHRVRGEADGPARTVKGRRPSPLSIPQSLRAELRQWREAYYVGASDTSRYLLSYWFDRPHPMISSSGDEYEFRYYFCQREAIEALVYLKEVRVLGCLSQVIAEFGGQGAEIAALGVTEQEDAWSRYAFKLATGTGKTKVMSLAIVWSYFHALRESSSSMARHFVVIAPNLTVYERLKDDFGDGRIFGTDPLIPSEWRGDWDMSVVLQDEASGASTGGVLYLTNIHRLYDVSKRQTSKDAETYSWMGPAVSKATALDTGKAIRQRILSHKRVMVLNDEAHHVWDPDSAWNDALRFLHDGLAERGGSLVAQLDFSATPRDDKGQPFKHIVCDAPLGEAVDGGIVKTPVIGKSDKSLSEEPSEDAAYRYDRHLRIAYERWKASRFEWEKSGKKALMFVMCEDTDAADQVARRLNSDETFKELNGKTINLHTNLKGKMRKVGRGEGARLEFVEDEKRIGDDDLRALRKLSRELDANASPYLCVVSVLMLREGWDVRNVTTIVPLRALTAKANILPEQTLGRGLRRMTTPGSQGANEIVTVVEHPSFASLYQQELAQEGLPLDIIDVDKVPSTTVSIYPDEARKDVDGLDIELPSLSSAVVTSERLDGLTAESVRAAFTGYSQLPLAGERPSDIHYEGRHLFTNEIVEEMRLHLPLLQSGVGAVSYYVRLLESMVRMRGLHAQLAPLVETFLTEILFLERGSLFDDRLIARLGDADVREHILAVFVPLIRQNTVSVEQRRAGAESTLLSTWRPFQVTHSQRHPAVEAKRTLFNLAACDFGLEVAMVSFLDRANDVAAFARNKGPQALRIDYLATGHRPASYVPDFFVRGISGRCYMVETKGREDDDVPRKARAAVEWCRSASGSGVRWQYVFVPESVFQSLRVDSVEELARACEPSLKRLLAEPSIDDVPTLFSVIDVEVDTAVPGLAEFTSREMYVGLPERDRDAIRQSVVLFGFLKNKEGMNYAPVLTPMFGVVDSAVREVLIRHLRPSLPGDVSDQRVWFTVDSESIPHREQRHYEGMAQNLRRTLVFGNGQSPIGLLRNCLDYGLASEPNLPGVFATVRHQFSDRGTWPLVLDLITEVNDIRNRFVAHQEEQLTDVGEAKRFLKTWIEALAVLRNT